MRIALLLLATCAFSDALPAKKAWIDFAAIPPGICVSKTMRYQSARIGHAVTLVSPKESALFATGYVSAPDTVTIKVCNTASSAVDPKAGLYRFSVKEVL